MKIKHSISQPKAGATRQVTKFLWLPLTLESETRWLEVATYTEEWVRNITPMDYDMFWQPLYWGTPKCSHGYDDWDDCSDCGH